MFFTDEQLSMILSEFAYFETANNNDFCITINNNYDIIGQFKIDKNPIRVLQYLEEIGLA